MLNHHSLVQSMTRREWLWRASNGFGALALTALWTESAFGRRLTADSSAGLGLNPLSGLSGLPHHAPKAKNVIFLFMEGGPSQLDTFDPKPRLDKEHGQPIKMKTPPTQFNNVGAVLKSPWKFRNYGQSGIPVSELFPQVATCIDDIAVIRSMTANFSEHTNANFFLHSGNGQQGRPSMGAWATYGLGSECQNLPGFIVLHSGMIPPGGVDCFHSGFLPASHQGSLFQRGSAPIADLNPPVQAANRQDQKRALLRSFDQGILGRLGHDPQVEAAIANAELAFRMQSAVPDLMDLRDESQATQSLYGLDHPTTELYGKQCLIARRLVERGVRFIELLPPSVGHDRWDQHANLKQGHEDNARSCDKPIAGLLKDLKARGLLDQTLVVWAGEFGRTPMAQGSNGRDHNPYGFSIWLAGGGVKGGVIHGATDEYGYFAIENKTEIHDLHATMLHLLGVDHTRLTYRFGGRDMRLTDVHGKVVKEILA